MCASGVARDLVSSYYLLYFDVEVPLAMKEKRDKVKKKLGKGKMMVE